jgi:hypothetical protein
VHPCGVKFRRLRADTPLVSGRLRYAYSVLFLLLAAWVWTLDVRVGGILRVFPWRAVVTAVLVCVAFVLFLPRRRGGASSRFGASSRWLLVGAWALGGIGLGLSQLIDYDDECATVAGAGWHPIAVVFAGGGLLIAAASVLAAIVENVQRRSVAAALTLVGGFLSLYPLFILGLLVLVGCDNS